MHWSSAYHTCADSSWDDMSMLSTHLQNVSIKSQIVDALLECVHNVDRFYSEFYEQMAEAEELDALIRQNLEVLEYGQT